MSKSTDCWGIEVGANAIKAIRLQKRKDEIVIADYDVLPFKKILTTPDLNVNEAIQVNLDQFLSRHSVSRSKVMISVPGHMAFARFAKLPPVDPKRIPDIVRFEAVQQIPFPIEQVEWDYQVFSQPDSPDVEVGIFAITKDRVNDFLENYNAVGMNVDGLTLSPLAVYNGLSYDLELNEEAPGVIIMDIGATSTDVIIVEEGHLWLRTLPIGGNNFTDALIRAFKLSFPKAEKLKKEAGTSKYARQIFQAMRPVFADLVQEMQRSLGFYQSLNRDAKLNKLVGVGSTFRLPGMSKFLKQQLQLEVTRLDGFSRARIEGKQEADFAEHAMNMATAYGLALQGLEIQRVDSNILPENILRTRMWRAKQPWMGAAAALMVAASGLAATTLWMTRNTTEEQVAQSQGKIKNVVDEAQNYIDEWHDVKGKSDPRQKIENLRRVLDYRDIWPKLLYDLDRAAKSLGPQVELIQSPHDYEAVMQIARDKRRRIYITSLTAEYVVPKGGATAQGLGGGGGGGAAMGFEDIWGGSGAGGPGAAGVPGGLPDGLPGGPGGMPGFPGDFSTGEDTSGQVTYNDRIPKFVIKISGITPNRGGSRFISDNFIKWFRTNAERTDRPYRVLKETPTLLSIQPVGAGKRGGGGSVSSAAPRRGRQMPARLGPQAQPTPLGGIAAGFGAPSKPITPTANNNRGRDKVAGLFPTRPTDEETTTRDFRFTATWTIELIRPEEARRSEDGDRARKPAPADGSGETIVAPEGELPTGPGSLPGTAPDAGGAAPATPSAVLPGEASAQPTPPTETGGN